MAVNFQVFRKGDYVLRVKAYAKQDSTNSMKLTFLIDFVRKRDAVNPG
jgi:hypothetical protein